MSLSERMDTALENQFTPKLNSRGYVIGGSMTRHRSNNAACRKVLKDASTRYPFDPSEIVWPTPDWPRDGDGRGWSVLEVEQMQRAHKARAA